MAMTDGHESSANRAGKLIALLIRKLESNPHMFEDTCTAFEGAGAEAVVSEMKGNIVLCSVRFAASGASYLDLLLIAEVRQKAEEIVPPSETQSKN